VIIFTDLDGTLLDHKSYGVRAALPAIDLLVRRGLSIVPVSSKTAAEIRRWIRLLTLEGPFICENGCGIVIPAGRFARMPDAAVRVDGEWTIALGMDVAKVATALEGLSDTLGFRYRTLDRMSSEELSTLTGLSGAELEGCLDREYDLPFVIQGAHDAEAIRRTAAEKGFYFTKGGRFYHLTGGCNKGEAVRILADLYRKETTDPLFVGIGDSLNDLPMFQAVDRAFLVQKPDGSYDPQVPEDAARRIQGIGPRGWRAAVEEVMALE